ncbi:MAG: hypothetical protein CVU53_07425 [Deltaproteobacteria bacterium HGW-Deltaproteobacteria-11]|jgi:hypothetical protein|nr:MAG: hypothetical protein CVU53_07425 [Deltaproteobacteria bacterium HGW-Deltaproteobacteria-11]
MSGEKFDLVAVDETNAVSVGDVFRSIYGDDFPVKDVYDPGTLWREVREGRVAATLAFDGEGCPVGYISLFKSAPNPRLWEGGNLIVHPACKYSDLSSILFRHYLKPENYGPLEADGFFGEAVCHHYFTQVGCVKSGMTDCAVELDLLDGSSFKDTRAGSGRVACVLNFLEFTRPDAPVHLPERYAEIVQRLSMPLSPRSFLPADAPLPLNGVTVREDRYHGAARTWKVYVREIGGDWREVVDDLLREAGARDVVSLQVTLNTAIPHLGAAVEVLRGRGFFLGGLAPRWFGNDGLLMQKVLGREPDFDGIKLYSRTAKDLLAFIRMDREETSRLAGGGVSA